MDAVTCAVTDAVTDMHRQSTLQWYAEQDGRIGRQDSTS